VGPLGEGGVRGAGGAGSSVYYAADGCEGGSGGGVLPIGGAGLVVGTGQVSMAPPVPPAVTAARC